MNKVKGNMDSKLPADAGFMCNQAPATAAVLRAKVSEMFCTLKMVMMCRTQEMVEFKL
jgi:hypothetical protein